MTENIHAHDAGCLDAVIAAHQAEHDAPAHDPEMMLRFLRLLDPNAERFTIQLFRDPKARKNEPLPPGLGVLVHHLTPEEIVAFAQKWNTVNHGFGMYVAVNETDFRGRSSANIVRVRALIGDADKNPVATVKKLVGKPTPSIVVRSSKGRRQFYWLCGACPLDQFKPAQRAFNEKYGTDPAVQDLPRVMRIPGTLHLKEEPQLVELKRTGDEVYKFDELLDGLGLRAGMNAGAAPRQAAGLGLGGMPDWMSGNGYAHIEKKSVEVVKRPGGWFDWLDDKEKVACLKDALAALSEVADGGREGWIKVLMAAQASGAPGAYEVARDWSAISDKHTDAEFDKQWASFSDRPGGIGVGTLLDMAKQRGWDSGPFWVKANGASWNREQIHVQNAGDLDPDDFSDYVASGDAPMPEPREWVFGTELIVGDLTIYGGPGGDGKTTRSIAICCAIASGKTSILGADKKIWVPHTKVLFVSSEDTQKEMLRRVKAGAKYFGLTKEEESRIIVCGKDSKRPIKLTRLNQGTNKAEIDPTGFAELERTVKHFKPSVVFLDPLQTMTPTGVNDGPSMNAVIAALKALAGRLGISIAIIHHVRKGNDAAGPTVDAIKGASDITQHARVAFMVMKMTAAEARGLKVPEKDARRYFRLGSGAAAKQNMSPQTEGDVWYQLIGVNLDNGTERYPNGDNVQVATIVPDGGFATILPPAAKDVAAEAVLRAIRDAEQNKRAFSDSGRGRTSANHWGHQLPQLVKAAIGSQISENDLITAIAGVIKTLKERNLVEVVEVVRLKKGSKSTNTGVGLRLTREGERRLMEGLMNDAALKERDLDAELRDAMGV